MSEGTGLLDVVTGASRQVGNYFNVLSGLTSVVMVGFPALLLASGAPARRPSLSLLDHHLHNAFGLGNIAAFGVLVLVTGITMHPLQFGMTQILEGYWGHGRLQRLAMSRCERRHMATLWALMDSDKRAEKELKDIDDKLKDVTTQRDEAQSIGASTTDLDERERELLDGRIDPNVALEMAGMAEARYPARPDEILPTRLGNVLRRHERLAGARFKLDAVNVMPYISLVAEGPESSYLDDTRSAMDLPIRMVLVWALCTLEGVFLLWQYDFWLSIPLLTYGLAYLAYRGAVSAANDYGNALSVILTLGRRNLYDRLNIEFPPDLDTERDTNAELDKLLAGGYGKVQFTASPAFKAERKRWWPW
jgi:hypothetical protein